MTTTATTYIGLVAGDRLHPDGLRRGLLCPAEWAKLDALEGAHQRAEWLTGRLVAKWAVAFASPGSVEPILPRDIQIETDDRGAPWALIGPGIERKLAISISHCEAAAGAAVRGDGGRVGLDLELTVSGAESVIERICARPELDRLGLQDSDVVLATIVWSLKEAAIKCLGGLTARRRLYTLHPSPGTDWRAPPTALSPRRMLFRIGVDCVPGRHPPFLWAEVLAWSDLIVAWVTESRGPIRLLNTVSIELIPALLACGGERISHRLSPKVYGERLLPLIESPGGWRARDGPSWALGGNRTAPRLPPR